ncbi:TonB-dependent receptor [Sphingobacterium sp. SGG-5]|uniref:TonB-dependent receptor n=1 Tax=Sphingobacterium sp. SGG-5 TaxID=2710881 RepID=UPI0013ECE9A0|nr:TonB-dependent receptor [Sphingobacterium sp. SGG-5]NGM62628.1 TonB-dependent receptor [Sphingobacterium sp. SGG-5]
MRINIVAILLFVGCMQISGKSRSQTVSMKAKAQSLSSVFSTIEKQTGYYVMYSSRTIQSAVPVSITATNMPLKEFLEKVLTPQSLNYTIDEKTILVTRADRQQRAAVSSSSVAIEQQREISGRVTNVKGDPVVGITVAVKGTAVVAMTDDRGNYHIMAPESARELVFTGVGYAMSEVSIGTSNSIDVLLQDAVSHLDEVIIVGYGTQKRRNVVGSVSQIDGEELQKAPAMNLTNALAGRLPGLTTLQQSGRPGADNATLRVRGTSSYASQQTPLILIDGVQRSSFAYLDPAEIESISVLKDAVSTAVYGLQATNGIILITTKKGRANDTKINYEGSFQIGQNTRFPKFLNAIDYMMWHSKGIDLDNDYLIHQNSDPVPYVYGPRLIRSIYDGTNTNPLFGQTDWVGELLGNNSKSQHHSVSISGGNEKSRYFSSLSHLDQGGVIKNTNFKRYNVRTNVSSKLTNLLSADLNVAYRVEVGKTPGISPDNTAYLNPFYQAAMMLPNLPMYAENGIYTAYNSSPGWINPLASVEHSGYQHRNNHVFQGDVNLKFSIPGIEGLDLQLLMAYDKTSLESKSWLQPYKLMGRARDQKTGDFVELSTTPGITKTSLTQAHNQNNRMTFRPYINYTRSFGLHDISVLGLYEWSKYQQSILTGGARNFPLEGLHDLDFGSTEPDDMVRPGGNSSHEARAGYVARLNYAFDSKYLLEVASRWDASVNFAPQNRWKMFPGLGLGWIISSEDFFKDNVPFVNFLKLKYSTGKTGNDKVGESNDFAYLQTYLRPEKGAAVYVIGGSPVTSIYTSRPPNPDLIWETSTTHNIGFESQWLDNKLGFDLEFFHRFTVDILNPASGLFPPTMGGYYPGVFNDGEMLNRGIDAQLRYTDQVNDFRYSITGNFNWAKNKIITRRESENLPAWQRTVGHSHGAKLGFVVDGMYQTWEETKDAVSPSGGVVAPGFYKYRDLNNDGRLTRVDDMTFIGRSNIPEIMYGLNIDLQYRGFDLSTLFQGAALSDVFLSGPYEGSSATDDIDAFTVMSRTFYQNGNTPYFLVENSWRPDNPNAEFPRLTAGKAALGAHNAHANSGYLRNGAYLRLKSLQIGYTIPTDVVQKVRLGGVRLHATASNLFTWDYLKYFDPEMPNVNNGFYPQQKLFAFGVSVTFK